MRMRKKKNLLPRMERCGAYQIKDPYERKGRWHDLMPEAKEIRVELGCGKGRFTVETAAAEPDVLLIAVEKVPDAMVVAMERAAKAELHNVFFIDIDANRCELWFRIKEGVSNEELPEILEHVTGPSLFRIRSVIASSSIYCLEYKSKLNTCNTWDSIINEIDEPKSEPESEPKF